MTREKLAEKYRRMAQLRATLLPEPSDEQRRTLKQLAREFPGALRELDSLPTDEIAARLQALESGVDEPWMRWMGRFHTLMRAALEMRAKPGQAAELALAAGADEAFANAVKSPLHGRLMVVVFDRIAAEEGGERGVLWDQLFPPRRGPREYRRS